MMRFSSAFSFAFVGLFLAACAATPDGEPAGDTTSAVSISPFASAEQKLFAVFDGNAQRGGDVYDVDSTHPIEDALKGYVKAKYSKDDPDALTNYTYKTNSNTFQTDTQECGTIDNSLAWKVISGDIDNAGDKDKAKASFDDLVQQGAVFGYDGFEESGCAAPTDFLLVIDPKGKKVYTIELTPCDES
jgi:hypothetical protein